MNKRYWLLLLLPWGVTVSIVPSTQAATIPAASCNNTAGKPDVQTAVNSAASGDIVTIPTGSCTWTQTLTITKPITLTGNGVANSSPSTFGAGNPTTIITHQASGGLISVSGLANGQFVRISLLDLEPSGDFGYPITMTGTCNASGCPLFRIDNILWGQTSEWTEYPRGAATLITTDNLFGVIDHNTVPVPSSIIGTSEFVNINHTSWQGIGNGGDNSIVAPSTFGTDQSVYLENNSFFMASWPITENEFPANGGYPSAGGSRITARFNQLTDWNGMGVFGYHGTETGGRSRTGRQMEVYGNTLNCEGSTGCNVIAGVRGGVEYMFGNTLTIQPGGWVNEFGFLQTQRTFRNTAWYLCNGLDPYDDNDGYASVWTGTLGSLAGGSGVYTITVAGAPWTAGAFNFSVSSPGPNYYVVFDATIGWIAGIASNTANQLTTSFMQDAGAGSGYAYAAPGDALTIYSATLYDAGTYTGTSQTSAVLTDSSKNWAVNQWAPVNGHAYNITNLTQNTTGYSWQIASNTSNTATQNVMPYPYWLWNNGDVYLITGTSRCLDQASAIGGQLFNPSPMNTGTLPPANPVGATTEITDPSYEFKDVGPAYGSLGADSLNLVANRDYFTDGANSNEWTTPGAALTAGVAWGKWSNRPGSCTPGVGYWATDQGTWNQSGNSFAQGELFVCTGPTTWALHYTPYTYPHPLISGVPLVPPPPSTNASGFSPQVYPNPWRSDKHTGKNITFDGLTIGTDIKIFTVSGHKVAELHTDGPSVQWTLTNDSGDKVASGIYLYVITDNAGDKVRGKMAIIR
jgi:hypothetical protein